MLTKSAFICSKILSVFMVLGMRCTTSKRPYMFGVYRHMLQTLAHTKCSQSFQTMTHIPLLGNQATYVN